MSAELVRFSSLGEYLSARIKGQEDAVSRLTAAVQRGEMGVSRDRRPKGSFLLLGPTGTGKTEISLALVRFLAGVDDDDVVNRRFARFDMAEYQESSGVGRLIGRHRDEQGLLGDAIDRVASNGGGVILFDEIEKADGDLTTLFLSAMDSARVTMANGQTKNLRDFYLIFTSNLGSGDAAQMQVSSQERVRKHIMSVAQSYFRPELFARFDEKIVFNKLDYETQVQIAQGLLIKEIKLLCDQKNVQISVGGSVLNHLIKRGFDRILGARPMRGAVEREIGNAWSRFLLERLRAGESVNAQERLVLGVFGHELELKKMEPLAPSGLKEQAVLMKHS